MRCVCLSVVCLALVSIVPTRGQERSVESSNVSLASAPLIDRFLATADAPPIPYRALRHLTAQAGERKASLTARTSFDAATGFAYEILEESGSGIIRSKVLRAALDAEKSAKQSAQPARAALTTENYQFDAAVDAGEGRHRVGIHPRRKEPMMIDGSIVLASADADLLRVEGLLVKCPSFWTRRVEVIRHYARIAGLRVPVSMTSTADVLFVGKSTFDMRYEYESVNGTPVTVTAPAAPPGALLTR